MHGLKIKHLIPVVGVFIFLSGCSSKNSTELPNIHYGQDVCAECRMIIAEKKFSAGFVDKKGDGYKFDDIGCMRLFIEKNSETPAIFWVHDLGSEEWIEGIRAFFTHSKTLRTPMGYGIAAFSNADSAGRYLKENEGETVSWEGMKPKGG